MFCPNCGKQNADDVRFCGNCGTEMKKVTTVSAEKRFASTEFKAGSMIKSVKLKNNSIFIIIAAVVLVLLFVGIFSSSGKEVPEDIIASYIADESVSWKMEGYKIDKVKHNYDSAQNVDSVTVEVIIEDTYADVYKTYELNYNYNSSVKQWTIKNDSCNQTEIKWKKSMFKVWSGKKDGNDYSLEIHSIDGSEPGKMQVVCSYRVEGPNCFVIGTKESHSASYNDNGVLIDKEDSKGIKHYINFRISAHSGVVMDLIA